MDASAAPPAAAPLSKRQQKRQEQRKDAEEYWAAKKQKKKEGKKAARRAEAEAKQVPPLTARRTPRAALPTRPGPRQAAWEALTDEEKQARREQAARERAEREAAQEAAAAVVAAAGPTPVCVIDLDFDGLMDEPEVRSLVQQLMYAYGANRRVPRPLRFHLSSLGGRIEQQFVRINGHERWAVTRHAGSYLEAFPRESVVYLSSEADALLTTLRADEVYVIGGLVDHNKHKGLTQRRAVEAGVRTARLPIDEHLQMSQRRVLAVNHVFEILLHYTQHADWAAAFAHAMPQRRGATPRDAAGTPGEAGAGAAGEAAADAPGETGAGAAEVDAGASLERSRCPDAAAATDTEAAETAPPPDAALKTA